MKDSSSDPAPPDQRRVPTGGAWRALSHRNYRLFFSGQAISLVGTWMVAVAQSWLVLQLTHDPFMLGVVAAAQFLPVLVLGLLGGVITDLLPRRPTLMVTQAVAMSISLLLFALVATDLIAVWQILLLAFINGIRNAIDMPARQAFVVELVGREDVPNAVALNSAIFNSARIIGPALAGLAIGAFDISLAFLIDGLSFLAVLIALALMDVRELRPSVRAPRPTSLRSVGVDLADGLRYVRRTEVVLLAITVVGLVSTFGMNFSVLVPALAQNVLHTGASGYGFLMAASGVGSLATALLIASHGRPRLLAIAIGGLGLGVAEIVVGGAGSYAVAMLAMVAVGAAAILMSATANTAIQLAVPDILRGRVMSVYTTVFAGSTPVGGLLMGAIASLVGVATAFVAGGVICAVTGAGALAWARRIEVREAARLATAASTRIPAGADGALVPLSDRR